MVRPTDQEMVALKKTFCSSQIPRGGGMLCHPGPYRKHQGRQEAEGEGVHGQETLLWFTREEVAEAA